MFIRARSKWPSSSKERLIDHFTLPNNKLMNPARFRQLWILILLNIFAILGLATVLFLISQEPASLILSGGMALCAISVTGVIWYLYWSLLIINEQNLETLSFFDELKIGLMITDSNKEVILSNRQMNLYFGSVSANFLETLGEQFVHEVSSDTFYKLYYAAFEGETAQAQVILSSRTMEPSLWLITIYPATHKKTLWLFNPVTLQELKTKDFLPFQDFDGLFARAPFGVALLSNEGTLLAHNDFFKTNLVDETQLVTDMKFLDLLDPNCHENVQQTLTDVLEGKPLLSPLEMTFLNQNIKSVSAYATPIIHYQIADPDPQIIGVLLNFFDQSDQKKLQIQLVQSQKMQALGQLAGGIAHDFNNLLTAIIGFCDLLLTRHSPGDQSFADIMQIKQNSNRAANLVRQLLAFSRQQTLQPQVLNIVDVISDLTSLLQRLVGIKINLHINYGRNLSLVRVDKGQLEQVLVNLVVNARDAMNGQGDLNIKVHNQIISHPITANSEVIPKGNYIVIEVQDTGCGIDQDHVERIFDPFFSTKEVGRGTGLGLSMVYGIIKQTGGHILVESEKGKGSKFSVIIPSYQPKKDEEIPRAKSEKRLSGDLTGYGTLLFVEDEDAVRLFGTRALQDKGYHVIEARNGEEALSFIHSLQGNPDQKIDLLITDVVMPGMDGPTLVNKVHSIYPALKVIYISGYAEDAFRESLGQQPDILFLAKPFNLKELAAKVKEALTEDLPAENPEKTLLSSS